MRKKIIAGNWKMNLDHREGAALARDIVSGLGTAKTDCEVVVFPPFTSMQAVSEALAGSRILLGGQDMWTEPSGAFTGEVSPGMLLSLGCTHVLVGHSERRHVMGEQPALLKSKLRAAISSGLIPVYCVGELLDDRGSGRQQQVVADQLESVLEGLGAEDVASVITAYEPVWAIGTGKTATPEDASEMHAFIREWIGGAFSPGLAEEIPILYGGSVKPGNAADLLSSADIDGALVGGASLDAGSFLDIVFADST